MKERGKGLPNFVSMRIIGTLGHNALVQGSRERRNQKKNNLISYIILSAEIDLKYIHIN